MLMTCTGLLRDMQLLQYLRARNFDMAESFALFNAGQRWRHLENIDSIQEEGLYPPDGVRRQALLTVYPHTLGESLDRAGRPVRIDCVGRMQAESLLKHFGGDWAAVRLAAGLLLLLLLPGLVTGSPVWEHRQPCAPPAASR
jgi:hypothetical protein